MIPKWFLAKCKFSIRFALAKGIRLKTGAAHPGQKVFGYSYCNKQRYLNYACFFMSEDVHVTDSPFYWATTKTEDLVSYNYSSDMNL